MPRRSDYQATPYHLDEINLNFYIHSSNSVDLISKLHFTPREGRAGEVIELNGEEINLISLAIQLEDVEAQPLQLGIDYAIEVLTNLKGELTNETILRLLQPPVQPFTLIVENHIDPSQNDSGHGLYQSDALLTTQCESAGFRRITYSIDRPDNLGTYWVSINAQGNRVIVERPI